jgi:glycosyltransferase involved in cell wall biosynthesis
MGTAPLRAAPYAEFLMDARTGEVLRSRNADTRLHPASLTKMLTLYVAFEAVRRGEITLDTQVEISRRAANTPYAIGFRQGSSVPLRYLLRAAAVRSSNDAATAIAEAISGSVDQFSARMNRTARALGMESSTFKNPHGLTQAGHLSTARDMSVMGRRLFYDYPEYYNLFGRRTTNVGIKTVRNTNRRVLDNYRGADGIKTGFTNAAGFNLVASAEQNGVRVIATYARVLSEMGHEVHVVSAARSRRRELRNLWYRLTGRKDKAKHKQHSPLFAPLGDRHIFYNPDRPFDPNVVPDGDAVFATWWRTADQVMALPAAKGRKFYMLQDYEAFAFQPVDEVAATYQLPMHKIAVSGYIRDEIIARHGPMEIEVVNNAVDLGQFAAPPRQKSSGLTVGFLYNTHPRKRIDIAIEALKRARAQYRDLKVIVFGGLPPSIKVPLPDWVRFHQAPPQDQIPKLYQACDLWLFPSEHEGLGLPLLEAMASRTPVLATPAGGAPKRSRNSSGR